MLPLSPQPSASRLYAASQHALRYHMRRIFLCDSGCRGDSRRRFDTHFNRMPIDYFHAATRQHLTLTGSLGASESRQARLESSPLFIGTSSAPTTSLISRITFGYEFTPTLYATEHMPENIDRGTFQNARTAPCQPVDNKFAVGIKFCMFSYIDLYTGKRA